MIIQIVLSTTIVPHSQSLAKSFIKSSNITLFENFIKPRKFNDTINGLTIYIDNKDENGRMTNLYLKKENKNGFQITYAKKGEFKTNNGKPIMVLYDGETINAGTSGISNFTFSKSDFSLNNLKTNTTTYTKTQELTSLELYNCIYSVYFSKSKIPNKNIENCTFKNLKNIFKESYKRIIIPFYIPILALIVFFLIIYSKENKNYNKFKLIIFLIGLFLIIFSETTIRLISDVIYNNIIIIFVPCFSFLIFYLIILKKLNFKHTSK